MPIVLVELPDTDAADANVPALIAACSSGLRRGECAAAEPAAGERAVAVAIVVWLDADHLRARIDVGRRTEQRSAWQVRELTFQDQDALLERWRSVGLAIAGVVGEATLLEPARPAPPPKPVPPPRASRLAYEGPSPRAFRVALGPELGNGLRGESVSAGGWLGVAWRCCGSSPFELGATALNAWSLHETSAVATHFTTLGVGAGGMFDAGAGLAVRGSLFAILEAVAASATDPTTGQHAAAARWLFGGLGRVEAAWPQTSAVAGVLGSDIVRLSGATGLRMLGQPVALSPAWNWDFHLGLECRF